MAEQIVDVLAAGMDKDAAAGLRKILGQGEKIWELDPETLTVANIGDKRYGQVLDVRAQGPYQGKGFALRGLTQDEKYLMRWEIVKEKSGMQVLVCYLSPYTEAMKKAAEEQAAKAKEKK